MATVERADLFSAELTSLAVLCSVYLEVADIETGDKTEGAETVKGFFVCCASLFLDLLVELNLIGFLRNACPHFMTQCFLWFDSLTLSFTNDHIWPNPCFCSFMSLTYTSLSWRTG